MGKLRPNLLIIFRHFTKHVANPHLNRNDTSPKNAKRYLLTSSIISILFASPIHATTTADLSNSKLSTAISLLGSVSSCIESGPATLNYRTLVKNNIELIKADLLAAQTEVTEIADDRDLYENFTITVFPYLFPFISSITTSLSNSTLLILINQTSLSSAQEANLGNYTDMMIVGNYTPTKLTYSSLINLQTLQMFDGTMTDSVRNAISNLAKTKMKLKYLKVPKWGTSIEDNAFALNSTNKAKSIQEVVGFEDVTTVGYRAFYYCAGLKSVVFPKVTTLAGQYMGTQYHSDAFWCAGLVSLSLPLLTTAGDYAFYNCTGLKSLSLPLLTTAGRGEFENCQTLTTLSLPRLTIAGDYAFYNCKGLTTLSLQQLTTAGHDAFSLCSALQDITLSDNLLSVATDAFNNTTPTTLRLIGHETSGNDIVDSCEKLSNAGLNGKIMNFYYILGEELRDLSSANLTIYINNILNIQLSNFTLFKNSGTGRGILDLSCVCDSFDYSVTANNLISYILPVLYHRANVTELSTLQSAVDLTVVGNYTAEGLTAGSYEYFTHLQSLRLFEGIMTAELFTAISNLVRKGVLMHLEISNCETIPESAFEGCTSLQKFVGEGVTSTGTNAFKGCTALTTLVLPKLTKANVGANAFLNVPAAAIPEYLK